MPTKSRNKTSTTDRAKTSNNSKRIATRSSPATVANKAVDDLRFDLLRSALYNGARERWYAGLHRLVMFGTTIAGTGAAASILGNQPDWIAAGAALLVAALSTSDLVLDLSGKARLHNSLRGRFFELLSETETIKGSPKELASIKSRMTLIYGDEPPTMRALDAICWNEAYQSTNPEAELKKMSRVTAPQHMLRHIWAFPGVSFAPEA